MRSSRACLAAIACALLAGLAFTGPLQPLAASTYRVAMPGYEFTFPRDHFDHPDFQTEWWYYTGNLRTPEGRRFGFELTFFRQAITRDPSSTPSSPWTVRDVYLAHFAVSDIGAGGFHHDERLNRAGPGVAGASADTRRIWNGNWEVRWEGEQQKLRAISATFSIELTLRPSKPPVVHGRDGVSQKAAGPGRGSHYISFTRLLARGSLELGGVRRAVEGTAWMDHEFFTHQLEAEQAGWDWFSLQLDDGAELMLFRLRKKDGTVDPFSAGTYVGPEGRSRHLSAEDFQLQPGDRRWRSPRTGAVYPIEWKISVTPLGLALHVRTPLEGQEIVARNRVSPNYWEGAIDIAGWRRDGTPSRGVGYLEMTGYDRPVRLGAVQD